MTTRRKFIKTLAVSPALLYLNSCASTKRKANQKRKLLYSFIFCNDLHITTDQHADYFAQSIESWSTFSPLYDFLVIGGDMANNGFAAELEKVKNLCDRLQKPFYPLVGNHDVSGPGEAGKIGYRRVFGTNRENYIIEHKKTILLFLDLSEGMEANVLIKKEILDWVQASLKTLSKKIPLIVFTHFPLHPDTPQFAVKNSSELFEILDTRQVLAYFSGHYHSRWQSTRNGVPFFTNPCLSLKRDNHDKTLEEGYLLVNVFSDSVERHFFARGTSPAVG